MIINDEFKQKDDFSKLFLRSIEVYLKEGFNFDRDLREKISIFKKNTF